MLAADAKFFNTRNPDGSIDYYRNLTELYNFASGTWELVPDNPGLVTGFAMVYTGNIFYIFGGFSYIRLLTTVNIAGFDSQTRSWFIVSGFCECEFSFWSTLKTQSLIQLVKCSPNVRFSLASQSQRFQRTTTSSILSVQTKENNQQRSLKRVKCKVMAWKSNVKQQKT